VAVRLLRVGENGVMTAVAGTSLVVLEEDVWWERARLHAERVDAWTEGRRSRASRGQRHPVDDFLFEYYPTRPGQLRRWHPGLGLALAGATPFDDDPSYLRLTADGRDVTTVDSAAFARRRDGLAWVEGLVRRTAEREGRYGCFGLHEWAMVHGLEQDEVRHRAWPLRVPPAEVEAVVDELGLRCTHVDAYRFFTPSAAARNELRPTRDTQPDLDQPGCLHATMDLYKWSSKYAALVGSDVVADCFGLAREARRLDMQAAPYDLVALGYDPIRVETAEGRAEYVRRQRDVAAAGTELRTRLATALTTALLAVDAT
jgi:hypothetical protein